MTRELHNSQVTKEKVQGAVKGVKAGKAVGLDGFAVECLKSGDASMIEGLVELLNVRFMSSMLSIGWASECVVSLYKGKGDRYECTGSRYKSAECCR